MWELVTFMIVALLANCIISKRVQKRQAYIPVTKERREMFVKRQTTGFCLGERGLDSRE